MCFLLVAALLFCVCCRFDYCFVLIVCMLLMVCVIVCGVDVFYWSFACVIVA